MKMLLLLALLFIGFCESGKAQNAKSTKYDASGKLNDLLSDEVKYHYPKFLPGHVFFRDGTAGAGIMNYNMLAKEIHFIDPKGDTLALDQLPLIKYLTIGPDTFFYNKGVLQVIGNYDNVKLAVKEVIREVDRQKIGAFGMTSTASSIDSYNSIRASHGTYRLSVNENVVYAKERTYYLQVKEYMLLPVNWNNIAKAFPSKKDHIATFASENKIDLNKEEDLKKLLTFCGTK
jgi:hypothetical protein